MNLDTFHPAVRRWFERRFPEGPTPPQLGVGDPDGPAFRVGLAVTDMVAGLLAAQGIALALFARERTGRGQHLDVSLTDCAAREHVRVASEPLEPPGERGRRRLVPGGEQRHHLVAEFALGAARGDQLVREGYRRIRVDGGVRDLDEVRPSDLLGARIELLACGEQRA